MKQGQGQRQAQVLAAVKALGQSHLRDIAQECGIPAHVATCTLHRLVVQGRVTRLGRGLYETATPSQAAEVHRLAGLRRAERPEAVDVTALANVVRIVRAMRDHYLRKAQVEATSLFNNIAVRLELSALHADQALQKVRELGT